MTLTVAQKALEPMEAITLTREWPLQRNAANDGSHHPQRACVEWTPEPDTTIPLRSTWRQAIGKPLSNAAIARYAREGRYGLRLQQIFRRLKHDDGLVHRCACGSNETRYLRFSYLPCKGWYCLRCVAAYRAKRDHEAEADRRFNELVQSEYV